MKYSTLRYKHINKEAVGGVIYVTFSAWHPKGLPAYFGENFFVKKNIETFLIASNGKNHWWQTSEIFQLAKIVKKRSIETGKKIVLYGSSMGAYAACHLREVFESDYSLAIAPQLFIDQKIYQTETRWIEDLEILQSSIIFNELSNLNDQIDRPLYILYDSKHVLDASYIDFYKKNVKDSKEVHIIDVPYTNHDVARGLNSAKVLSKIVLSFNEVGCSLDPKALQEICSKVYLDDDRSFINFFRKLNYIDDKEKIESLLVRLEECYDKKDRMDYAGLYMLAESLLLLGRFEEAINISLKSIEVYMYKYSKAAPNYLRNKFNYIVNKSLEYRLHD